MAHLVINPSQDNILKEHLLSPRLGLPRPASSDELLHGISPPCRNDGEPDLLIRRVEGECEVHPRQVGGQGPNPVRNPDRGDSDVARSKAKEPAVDHQPDGVHHGFIVVQGLTHAHEDDVAYLLYPHRVNELLEYLGRVQVPLQTHSTCCAKLTSHLATHLRAQAQCRPRFPLPLLPRLGHVLPFLRIVPHDNRLDLQTVLQLHYHLGRVSLPRTLSPHNL
mmetsp:Transcript_2242/g.6110  ORF Transcript_2242/g.6110 Transcript_2242/m.6110 type:complete len:221 (-) Transcript_2242:1938-2600(-)